MVSLLHQRCFNHAGREAVARCPECGRYFCRECIAEHDDRVICAACLASLARKSGSRRSWFTAIVRTGQVLLGLATAWLFFYWTGQTLLRIPSEFHEGNVWKMPWREDRL